MSKIQWSLVLLLSLSGVAFGLLTIFAVISGYEQWVAMVLLPVIAVTMALKVRQNTQRNAFAAGFLAALFAVWTQALFLPLYFENNPAYREVEIPFGLSAQAWTTLSAPVGAVVAGFLVMLIAWLVSLLVNRN